MSATTSDSEQWLEFSLGSNRFGLGIDRITEIAQMGDCTPVPNSSRDVVGVMDLRGRTTSVVDPKTLFDVGETGEQKYVLVFDPETFEDGAAVGWIVDDVHRVSSYEDGDIEAPPPDSDPSIDGIVQMDSEFLILLSPDG